MHPLTAVRDALEHCRAAPAQQINMPLKPHIVFHSFTCLILRTLVTNPLIRYINTYHNILLFISIKKPLTTIISLPMTNMLRLLQCFFLILLSNLSYFYLILGWYFKSRVKFLTFYISELG